MTRLWPFAPDPQHPLDTQFVCSRLAAAYALPISDVNRRRRPFRVRTGVASQIIIKHGFGGEINITERLRLPVNLTEGDGVMTISEQGDAVCGSAAPAVLNGPRSSDDPQSPNDPVFTPQLPVGPIVIETIDAGTQFLYYVDLWAPLHVATLDGSLFVEGAVFSL